jgi:hypothetical protein
MTLRGMPVIHCFHDRRVPSDSQEFMCLAQRTVLGSKDHQQLTVALKSRVLPLVGK